MEFTVQKQQQDPQVQCAIKLPKSFLDRVDKLAESMSQPGMKVTRTDIMRLATHRGVEQIEAEQKKGGKR